MNNKAERFLNDESKFAGHFDRMLWRDFASFWSRYLTAVLFLFGLGIVARSSLLTISLVIGNWVDSLCVGSSACKARHLLFDFADPWYYVYAGLLLLVIGVVGSGAFLIGIASFGARVSELIHNEMIVCVSRFPMKLLDRTPVGNIFTRFSSDFNSLLMANGPHLAQICMISLDLMIMFSLVAWIHVKLFFLCLPFFVFNVMLYRRNALLIRKLRREAASARSPSIAHFSSTIRGFLSVDLFSKREVFVNRFDDLVGKYYHRKSAADFAFYLFGLKISFSTAVLMLALSLYSLHLIQAQELSIGAAGVVISYVAIVASFIQRLFTLITSMEQGLTGAERIHEFIRKPIEPEALRPSSAVLSYGDEVAREKTSSLKVCRGAIKLKNVWLRYGENLPWVLKAFDLEIPAASSVGIIGRTGSGKTSLFQTLLCLYPHERGSITLDGYRLARTSSLEEKTLSLVDWRDQFAFITQEPRIFRASIRENLDPHQSCSNAQLADILRRVGLYKWFAQYDFDFDTVLAEEGGDMSVGQRQQLATARCLLRDTKIVLMDEATSAVDPQSEEFFLRATRDLLAHKTRLIIAHRLSTVAECDFVAWIKDGRIYMFDRPSVVLSAFKESESHDRHRS